MPERLTWSVEEASQILGVGRQLGYELARSGQIPTIRLGRRLLVPRAQLQAMLDRVPDRVGPRSESGGHESH